jgi:hypothetical protein
VVALALTLIGAAVIRLPAPVATPVASATDDAPVFTVIEAIRSVQRVMRTEPDPAMRRDDAASLDTLLSDLCGWRHQFRSNRSNKTA